MCMYMYMYIYMQCTCITLILLVQAASASEDPLLNSIFPESELQSKKRPPTVSGVYVMQLC